MANKLILIVHLLLITIVSLTVRSPFAISQQENLPKVQTLSDDDQEHFSAYTICTQPTINEPEKPYSLCNPITGRYITIPEPPSTPHARSPVTGLGFDPFSKVFKFIRIVDNSGYRFYHGTYLQIYNFKTRKWAVEKFRHGFNYQDDCQSPSLCSDENEFCHKDDCKYFGSGQMVSEINRFAHRPNTFLNGSFHWMLCPYDNDQMKIVRFDIRTEKFGEVAMPLGLDLDPIESRPEFMYLDIGIPSDWRSFQHYLLVLDERLVLVHHVNDEHVEIWVMNEYGVQSSWEKKYVIGKLDGPLMPVKLMPNGDILVQGYYRPVTEDISCIESMISEEQPTLLSSI